MSDQAGNALAWAIMAAERRRASSEEGDPSGVAVKGMRSKLARSARIFLLALSFLALSCARMSCGRQEAVRSPSSTRDWVETNVLTLLPFTATTQETALIDLGTDLGRSYLISGWSAEPPGGAKDYPLPVTYLNRRISKLFFHTADAVDRTLELRCAAYHGVRSKVTVALRLNGTYLGRQTFGREMSSITLEVPGRVQRKGRNELRIWASISRPVPRKAREKFGLSQTVLACERLRLSRTGTAPVTVPQIVQNGNGPMIVIPARTSLQFYARLGRGALLDLGAAHANQATVLVEESRSGRDPETLYRGGVSAEGVEFPLVGEPGEIALMRLTAAGDQPLQLDRLSLRRHPFVSQRPASLASRGTQPTNVILYIVDTLRADHLGCYGYERQTSPHIDAFARQSVLFEDTEAQASWTRPAVGSILTGVVPLRHGAVTLRSSLADQIPTLAELLHDAGYATAAFVTNMNVGARWGFDRGFDDYRYFEEDTDSPRMYQPAATVHREGLTWLEKHGDRPFFLYLHVTDPHAPYVADEPYEKEFERAELRPDDARLDRPLRSVQRRRRMGGEITAHDGEWLASLYDAEIAELDASFGELVAALKDDGTLDRTLFVFVADHGEEFFDHGGLSHGRTLYNDQLHVPLLVRFPDAALGGRRVKPIVRQVDILPSVLDYLALPAPAHLDGESFLAYLDDAPAAPEPRTAFSHTSLSRREISAITTSDWKVIVDEGRALRRRRRHQSGDAKLEAYDRKSDISEHADLAGENPPFVGYARQLLAAGSDSDKIRASKKEASVEQHLEPETLEKLRALGYVDE